MAGRPVHTFQVISSEQLTPHMIRLVLGGSGFDTFKPSEFTDSYVKFVIVRDDVDVSALPQAAHPGQLRRAARGTPAGGADLHHPERRSRPS